MSCFIAVTVMEMVISLLLTTLILFTLTSFVLMIPQLRRGRNSRRPCLPRLGNVRGGRRPRTNVLFNVIGNFGKPSPQVIPLSTRLPLLIRFSPIISLSSRFKIQRPVRPSVFRTRGTFRLLFRLLIELRVIPRLLRVMNLVFFLFILLARWSCRRVGCRVILVTVSVIILTLLILVVNTRRLRLMTPRRLLKLSWGV